jgi:hypothetical protein
MKNRRSWLLQKALESGLTLQDALDLAKQSESFLNLDDLRRKLNGKDPTHNGEAR